MSGLFERLAGARPVTGAVLPRPHVRYGGPAIGEPDGEGPAPERAGDTIHTRDDRTPAVAGQVAEKPTRRPTTPADPATPRAIEKDPVRSSTLILDPLLTIRSTVSEAPGIVGSIRMEAAAAPSDDAHATPLAPHTVRRSITSPDAPDRTLPITTEAPRDGRTSLLAVHDPAAVIVPASGIRRKPSGPAERSPAARPSHSMGDVAHTSEPARPIIEITIGRIEVRPPQTAPRSPRPAPFKPALGLDEYLQRRDQRRS